MNNKQRISKIKKTLGNSSDIIVRELNDTLAYIYLESVSSDDKISNFLLKSITMLEEFDEIFKLLQKNIFNSHIEILNKFEDCYYYLASGYTCLFINKENKYIVIESKIKLDRGVSESQSEPIIRGPKDSFTENNALNIGLIRKRIKDPNLWVEESKIGTRTQTKVSIIYIKGVAKDININKIQQKLKKINIDGILDSGYIRDYLEENQKSAFPKVQSTERPDLTCQALLNGKIAIMVENSPYVLLLPAVLSDFLKSSDDYYQKAINTSFSRILRAIAFIITIITPAIYIALMTFNQEMIPDQLLISLATQRSQVPFPTFMEVLIFIIIFEILRQADLRAPNTSGAAMSIVGALVLGDAAVAAGIVSPIVIIVVAITSICELVFIDMDIINAIRQWRFIFIFSTIFTGIIGIVVAGIIFIIKLASLESLNVPYLSPFSPPNLTALKDSIVLFPTNMRTKRNQFIAEDIKKAGDS